MKGLNGIKNVQYLHKTGHKNSFETLETTHTKRKNEKKKTQL